METRSGQTDERNGEIDFRRGRLTVFSFPRIHNSAQVVNDVSEEVASPVPPLSENGEGEEGRL